MSGGLFTSLDVAASGLTAESLRMDLIAGNIANANDAATPGQPVFKRQLAELQTVTTAGDPAGQGVEVAAVVSDPTPPQQVYDPSNPKADPRTGYVDMPNISITQEMIDLTDAQRAYEASATVFQASKDVASKTIDLLR